MLERKHRGNCILIVACTHRHNDCHQQYEGYLHLHCYQRTLDGFRSTAFRALSSSRFYTPRRYTTVHRERFEGCFATGFSSIVWTVIPNRRLPQATGPPASRCRRFSPAFDVASTCCSPGP